MVDLSHLRVGSPSPASTRVAAAPARHEPLPPAGWYVDPYDAARRRWWNGTEWTHDVRTVLPAAEPAYVAAPAVMNVHTPAFGDARTSIQDLAADLAGSGRERRPESAGDAPSASPVHGLLAARRTVPWYERPERNPVAAAALVFGLLSVVANPAAVMTVFALLLGAIGVAKSGGTYRAVGRRRAAWAIALGAVGGIAWGAASWWAFEHPEALAALGAALS